jgi:phospholipid/cholesterol/gamma-HCH transport system permease protein
METKLNLLLLRLEQGPSSWVLSFIGPLGVEDLKKLENYLRDLGRRPDLPPRIDFELSALSSLGSSGAALLGRFARRHPGLVHYRGLDPKFRPLLELLKSSPAPPPALPRPGFIETIGRHTWASARELYDLIEFFGRLLAACLCLPARPAGLRWRDAVYQMQLVGAGGAPIVGLIGLLVGMIIAFMSIMQLRDFGASIYVSILVALAMVKELAPIMTAIVVAGRSGSAFAAEIGGMKENEEIDALTVMGYDPIMFLAMPRLAAAVLMVPLLFAFAAALGIGGGMLVGVIAMDLDFSAYMQYTVNSLRVADIVTSLIKCMVFAFLIAGVSCQRGFAVRGGAADVGRAATSAVVLSIFIIIVVDSIFAIVGQYGWW